MPKWLENWDENKKNKLYHMAHNCIIQGLDPKELIVNNFRELSLEDAQNYLRWKTNVILEAVTPMTLESPPIVVMLSIRNLIQTNFPGKKI